MGRIVTAFRSVALPAVVLLGTLSAAASTINASLIQTSGEPSVGTGRFYGYRTSASGPGDQAFAKAKAEAEAEGVPLVVIWSNEDCHYCDSFTDDLNGNLSAVADWLKGRAVFAFFKDRSGDYAPTPGHKPVACYEAWKFVSSVCGSQPVWPLIGFYYVDENGKTLTWRHGLETNKTFAWLRKSYEKWVEDNKIGLYRGGQFTDVGSEFNRYEAEETTTNVLVRLVRDPISAASAWTNDLVAVWPEASGVTVTSRVAWAEGETAADVALTLRRTAKPFPVGRPIVLELHDADNGRLVTTNFIACVAPENAAANPKWIGEAFDFGEWTVDLEAAKAKVAAADGEAFTVVSLQGSKWCPDCANVDRNFLDLTDAAGKNAFREWAKARQVALVTIDIPNFSGPTAADYASPSLLDRQAFSSTLARAREWPQSGADAALTNAMERSGLGYLSRKSVDERTAAFYFNRNHDLAARNTTEGGFHRPEDGNANRTGVPIFVLLRKDGSVAARLTRMASVSPMAADRANFANYLKRFEEMMAVAATDGGHADAAEIENNYPGTGAVRIDSNGGAATGEICNADFQDTFRLDGAGKGTRQQVTVSGTTAANVRILFMTTNSSGKAETVAAFENRLDAAKPAVCDFQKDGQYFVQVTGADITSPEFDLANPNAANFHPFTVSAVSVLVPREDASTASAPQGKSTVTMQVRSGVLYRVTGIAGGTDGFVAQGGDLYRASADGDIVLTTAVPGGAVTYQIWRTGAIGFADGSLRFLEYSGRGVVTVVRGNGSSGAAVVRVVCDDCPVDDRFTWTNAVVSWADGEAGEKRILMPIVPNGVYDPDVTFHLRLERGNPCFAEISSETAAVTVYDTNLPCLEKTEYALKAGLDFETALPFRVYNVSNAATVAINRESGTVPAGLAFNYDAGAGEFHLSGLPSQPGEYEFTVTVGEKRGWSKVKGFATTVRLTVVDCSERNPFLSRARPNVGLPLYFALETDTNVVAGAFQFAITSRNKISARYSGTEGRALTFAGNWQSIGDNGTVSAVFTSDTDADARLSVTMDATGCAEAVLDLPGGYSRLADATGRTRLETESEWPDDFDFTAWKGTYNVTFPNLDTTTVRLDPSGTGFLSLRMSADYPARRGTVVLAGLLPNGRVVSGSGQLVSGTVYDSELKAYSVAFLPVFFRTGADCFSAVMEIGKDGAEKWDSNTFARGLLDREIVNPEAGTCALYLNRSEVGDCRSLHGVAGSYFEPRVSPLYLRDRFYEGKDPENGFSVRFALERASESLRDGAFSLPTNELAVVLGEKRIVVREKVTCETFTCNPITGVFNGIAKVTFETGHAVLGTYRGVLIPGWTTCGCGTDDYPVRPFGSGTFYFSDGYGADLITRSIPVDLDVRK